MGPLISMVPQCTTDECPTYKFIEKNLHIQICYGSQADFDAIRTRLLHDSATLTMLEALSDMLAEETRIQSMTTPHDSVPHSVLATS
jgi:hypothetical protein